MSNSKHSEFRDGWTTLLIALSGVVTSAHFLPLYSVGPMAPDLSRALDIPLGELQRCITFNFAGIAVGSTTYAPVEDWSQAEQYSFTVVGEEY